MNLNTILKVAGGAFLALFAIVWLYLTWEVLTHDVTTNSDGDPIPIKVDPLVVVFAGFLATTVATTTAGWLGIEIRKPDPNGRLLTAGNVSWWSRLRQVLSQMTVVTLGCYTFLVVGLIVTVVGLLRTDAAPEMYEVFMLGVVGWLAGAFAAAKVPAP